MSERTNFYCFEIKESEGNFFKLRKMLNGKCTYEGEWKWLSKEEVKKIRKRLIYESFYMNYHKVGFPKVLNINGFEIIKENEKMVIKYFTSGIQSGQSRYDLKLIDEKKEETIIRKISNLCLNNMELENQGYSLFFIISEVEREIFD